MQTSLHFGFLGGNFHRKVGDEFMWNTRWISPAVGSYWEPWLLTKDDYDDDDDDDDDNDKDDEIILPAIQRNVPNALQPSACS